MDARPLVFVALVSFAAHASADEPALVQFTSVDDATAEWSFVSNQNGVNLERRTVPGSKFYEHRAVTIIPMAPERVVEVVWSTIREGDMENLKRRQVIRETPTEIVMYDQIHAPVVRDRDYTLTVRRISDPARNRTEFRAVTTNELGPPPAAGHVRIPIIRAGWVVEPDGAGGTRLACFSYSEPGGLLGAWLVRGAQARGAAADVVRMSRRLAALRGR